MDKLVANAGVGSSGMVPSVPKATEVINVNLNSTIQFIKNFLPILSDKGRVVVVSSYLGQLNQLSEPLRQLLLNPSIT